MRTTTHRIEFGFVNAFLLASEKGFVLIDTGLPSHRKTLRSALEGAGCRPGNLGLVVLTHVVLTHADIDHAGNAAWLRETYGAEVAVHALDAPQLETGIAPPRTLRSRLGRLLTGLRDLVPRRAVTCPADLLLADGQDLGAWGLPAAKVIHLPGHNPGALGLLVEDGKGGGDFFAGDVLANFRRPSTSPFIHDLAAYRASLGRLRGLLPEGALVHPGHGQDFPASALKTIEL